MAFAAVNMCKRQAFGRSRSVSVTSILVVWGLAPTKPSINLYKLHMGGFPKKWAVPNLEVLFGGRYGNDCGILGAVFGPLFMNTS